MMQWLAWQAPSRFYDLLKSLREPEAHGNGNLFMYIFGFIAIVGGFTLLARNLLARQRIRKMNPLFYSISGRLRLSAADIRFLEETGRALGVQNLLLLFTQRSLWTQYLQRVKSGRRRRRAVALATRFFGEPPE